MKTFILVNPQVRANCIRTIQNLPDGWAVEIKEHKAKRSAEANRRYWAILAQIAEDGWIEGRRYSAEVWHEFAKRRFIGVIDGPGGISIAESSSRLNTKEFADYVQKVEVWAATELGITLTEPIEDYRRMK